MITKRTRAVVLMGASLYMSATALAGGVAAGDAAQVVW